MNRYLSFVLLPLLLATGIAALALSFQSPVGAQGATDEEPALPTEMMSIVIDAPENKSFKMAVVDFTGDRSLGAEAGAVIRNDFRIMPAYRLVDPRSITHDVAGEGMTIKPAAWAAYEANGVIKGQVSGSGKNTQVVAKFFKVTGGGAPALSKTYRGDSKDLRKWMHEFGNQVLLHLTGKKGPFGTKLTYARKPGPGRKDVYCSHMDGHNELRVSNGKGIAMLPNFEKSGHVWFTRLTQLGMFITRSGTRGKRIIEGNGLNMSPAVCHGRVFFVSSRDGNSEIYSAKIDGSDIRRLTNHPSIDVSPSCGPDGQLAFVSARHGTPQIFTMNADGSDQKRVTFRGSHNQTPAWCTGGDKNLIAFTGRDGTLDIFTVNVKTQEYVRVTQGQGMNKDPAWSPDCRLLAFSSDRRGAPGVYLSSPNGYNQVRVLKGQAETIRWKQ